METGKVSESKKRTLAALERRFAAAEAELELEQKKVKVANHKPNETQESQLKPRNSSSVIPARTSTNESPACSSKKGNFTFSGYSASEDFDPKDPTYLKLDQSVHQNLLTTNDDTFGRKESKVNMVLHNLFQKGDLGQRYLQGSRSKKIDNWILLDNYIQGQSINTASRIRALQIHSKRSKKHMSMKQHKKHGSLDLPKQFHKYDIFRPMHESWKNYMMQLLQKSGKNQLAQSFLDAELHGAFISVVDCKTTSLTGVKGIIIRETAETFGIITQDDKFKVIPKKLSVFVLKVDCWKVTLLGDKLTLRNRSLAHQT